MTGQNFLNKESLYKQGTEDRISTESIPLRFIPVYTGNTLPRFKFSIFSAVYPCVYREHSPDVAVFFASSGLSLCIQGTPLILDNAVEGRRFIPVYTGNTINTTVFAFLSTVYPCVYREHIFEFFCLIYLSGLSLCIQGTLQL